VPIGVKHHMMGPRLPVPRQAPRVDQCRNCPHLVGSHYPSGTTAGRAAKLLGRKASRSGPTPCHVLLCTCSEFSGERRSFLCPLCSRAYAGRTSLEIHFYGHHPGLATRERSLLLQAAVHPRGEPTAADDAELVVPLTGDALAEA
jgi:hypothetical protein